MRIKQQALKDAIAPYMAQAQATGRPVSATVLGHRIAVYPALNPAGMTPDQIKKAFRSVV